MNRLSNSKLGQERGGDGTVLADMIAKGILKHQAGSEMIGYFNPEIAPFRSFPNATTGILQGPMADQILQMMPAGFQMDSMLDNLADPAVSVAVRLGLSSTKHVLDAFLELVRKQPISQFLLVTTTVPFFLTYSIGKPIVSLDINLELKLNPQNFFGTAENLRVLLQVDLELKLNALAHLLLKDPSFSSVRSISEFEAKASSLLDERKQEVEEKKQYLINLQKSH